MSRRASDRAQGRLVLFLLALNAALAILASAIGYRALTALDAFAELADTVHKERRARMIPEAY